MSNPFQSRVWFITGTSSGLGRALVEGVLARGERVAAAVRNVVALNDLVAKYNKEQLLVVSLDVTDTTQIVNTFKALEAHFGRLDVVVNNAGYGVTGEIEVVPEADARKQVETLFWGPVEITKQAARFFREVNPKGLGGRVLNVSSSGGYSANATLAYYSAGKFALEGFTEAFTNEMPPEFNIKGIIIEPGGFPTKWAKANMVEYPPHPAYPEDSPMRRFLQMRANHSAIGDVTKAAQAMIRIASEPNPPLRIQLGSDAWGIVQHTANRTLKDQEKWAELSHSTNQDGIGLEILDLEGGSPLIPSRMYPWVIRHHLLQC
ncbi:hypothetical protein OF83DRAFT_314260 [Amylostereum chailletii]|nr:hypothetical protein OF83DRAFT_314260 [Amylostereum chailletii]